MCLCDSQARYAARVCKRTCSGLPPVKPALTLCHSQTLLRGHVNMEELPRSMWATGTPLLWLHPSLARCVGAFRDCLPSADSSLDKARFSRAEPDQRWSRFFIWAICVPSVVCMTEQEVGERMQTLQLNEKIRVVRKCPGGWPLKTGSMPE